MPKCVSSFRVCRVSSQRIRSEDLSAAIARGERSDRFPIGVPIRRSLPGTRRSVLQRLLLGVDLALELIRKRDERFRQFIRRRPDDFLLIEKENQFVAHAAGELGDSWEAEGTAGAFELVGEEKKLRERLLEAVLQIATFFADSNNRRLNVSEIIAPQIAELVLHDLSCCRTCAIKGLRQRQQRLATRRDRTTRLQPASR